MYLNNNQSNTTIMKNTFINYYLLSVVLLLSIGCSSDKGNYNYHDINDVTILNIKDDYSVVKGEDILHIEPILEGTLAKGDSENYSYSWTIKDRIISTEKNLDFEIDLEQGGHYLYFKVMDSSTGIEWKKYTYVDVSFPITRGFILACEDKEGYLKMDMIAMPKGKDTVILTDMLKNSELPKMKGARKIVHTGGMSRPDFVRLWVLGGDGSYFLNPTSFEGNISNNILGMLYSSHPIPEDLYPIDIAGIANNGGGGTSRSLMCNNGWVLGTDLYTEEAYGNPKNFVKSETTELFMPAPYLMYAPGYFNGALVLYDKDDERFVKVGGFDTNATKLADVEGAQFPWNNKAVGRTLVYAENTRNKDGGSGNGNTFSLMSNSDKTQLWIYKFYSYNAKKIDSYDVIPAANSMSNSSLFAFASNRTVMFYAVGNKLYAYDYNKGNEKFYDNLNVGNGGDEITMIKFDIQSESTTFNDLYIASYNTATGGTIRKVTLDASDTNTVTLIPDAKAVWSGFGKIKNMDWRNN